MEEPYPTYKALREHAPVDYNKTRGFWAVTKYDDTRTVLKDYSVFSNKWGIELDNAAVEFLGESDILELDPPQHKEIRGIFNPHFTPAKMRELEPRVRKLAEDLIEPIAERGEADISRDFCWTLPIQTICIMLGVCDHFGDGVEARRREPREDLLTAVSLSKNLKGEPMSDDEVGGLCLPLFAAGIITTGSFLSSSLYILRERNMVFGDGVHVCVGAHLARLEGRIGLRTVLSRIPDYELTGPIERTDRMSEHGVISMPVRF